MPVATPFATLQVQNKLVNVAMVPKAQFNGEEIENFAANPLLLDIALTLRADTTRVAVSTTGVISPTKEIGCYNHVVVFQYSPELSRWVYVTPPGP